MNTKEFNQSLKGDSPGESAFSGVIQRMQHNPANDLTQVDYQILELKLGWDGQWLDWGDSPSGPEWGNVGP